MGALQREPTYDGCIRYLTKNNIELFDYQKDILRAFIDGKEVRTARGIGRSFVARWYGKYIALLLDQNDYSSDPDVIFPYYDAIRCGLCSADSIKKLQKIMTADAFDKEILCL